MADVGEIVDLPLLAVGRLPALGLILVAGMAAKDGAS
jgi:hypothetical protein